MLPAALRIGIKIFTLIFSIIFVFFYVLLGIRYNSNLKKLESNNLYINFNFFSKNDWINFEWKKYFSSNWNLVIYNQTQGCYDINYHWKEKKICWENGIILNQNLVSFVDKKIASNYVCQSSNWIEFIQNFWEPILHFQRYKNIDFLFTQDKIFSCSGKNECNFLTNYSWDLVCFTKKWIIINQNSNNFLYELK